eukprot:TRINITY_DN23502_c0_g2_i1.p1 TRINITY_DN23502_c0_g2~~TRINITY_DN23502_c0_g2_i1.p1  ORF type:complete len:1241 (-),score=183.64 TRINITY_DN23502_c0_g2_i1:149-3871(-)
MGQVCQIPVTIHIHEECNEDAESVKVKVKPEDVLDDIKEADWAVVLAWALNPDVQKHLDVKDVTKLNEQVLRCCALLGCKVLLNAATHGLIRGTPLKSAQMTAEDTAVRAGQLLGRWAAAQRIALRVGVSAGKLNSIPLGETSHLSYFGDVCADAKLMVTTSCHDCMVHLRGSVKDGLSVYRMISLIISPHDDAFYLDPATMVQTYHHTSDGPMSEHICHPVVCRPIPLTLESKNVDGNRTGMTSTEFETLLRDHGVDVAKLGIGAAKNLRDLYDEAVSQQTCSLMLLHGVLNRVVNKLILKIRMRDRCSRLREVTCTSKVSSSLSPLSIVLKKPEIGNFNLVVERFLESHLGIPRKVQKACMAFEHDGYSLQEESEYSEAVPGITTISRYHTSVVNIHDPTSIELKSVGLPDCEDFETKIANDVMSWTWSFAAHSQEDALMALLTSYGIDVSKFAPAAFAELREEVYDSMCSTLEVIDGQLVRKTQIIKVWLHADVLNVEHVLVASSKRSKGQDRGIARDSPISMKMGVDQSWPDALEQALFTRVGLPVQSQRQNVVADILSLSHMEETQYSNTYPGLKTLYRVTEISARVLDAHLPHCRSIGLPAGTDFSVSRLLKISGPDKDRQVVTQWGWKTRDDFIKAANRAMRMSSKTPSFDDAMVAQLSGYDENAVESTDSSTIVPFGRVPAPDPLVARLFEICNPVDEGVATLAHLMSGARPNFDAAKRAASRIRDPAYTCHAYFNDVVASFPELRLYCAKVEERADSIPVTSSGRGADDEYQRTIGALLAFYWLMRLDLKGKEAFCFGLNTKWDVRTSEEISLSDPSEAVKRKHFLQGAPWGTIEQVLLDSKLLEKTSEGLTHNCDRTLTMLVLLAVHDIMKISVLLPCVSKDLDDFQGYRSGETINDHDVALSYVLQRYPQVLPSYSGLPTEEQKQLIRFVHDKIDYNMGWLVQGEAPPGALFRSFRKVIQEGQAAGCDVSFYFTYWFCDLAGAEPYPLEGCNKFVLKFPQHVLTRFLESFGVVHTLSDKTETEVLEEYYRYRWKRAQPSLGAPPDCSGSVARMRLVLSAQGDSARILQEFSNLPAAMQLQLASEMALTGISNQTFTRDAAAKGGVGPAILVYYAPALLQKAGKNDPFSTLRILAEIYRCARVLWPLSSKDADKHVTVRIDTIKDLEAGSILEPEFGFTWIMHTTSSKDAAIKLAPVASLPVMDSGSNVLLDFSWKKKQAAAKTSKFFFW